MRIARTNNILVSSTAGVLVPYLRSAVGCAFSQAARVIRHAVIDSRLAPIATIVARLAPPKYEDRESETRGSIFGVYEIGL